MTYRVYVTDSLKALGHLDGQRYIDRLHEILEPRETRTAEEIKEGIKDKLNRLGREE